LGGPDAQHRSQESFTPVVNEEVIALEHSQTESIG
jgi:hypothetical protein